MSPRARALNSATSRRRSAIMTFPVRSSRACVHQSASRRVFVASGSSETTRRSRCSAKARYSRPTPARTAARARRSSSSCWRRFSFSTMAPWRSTIPAKSPPAPTAGSCWGSPIRTALPPIASIRSRTGASTLVSAIPASSMITRQRGGSSSRCARSRSRWSVVDGMPVSSWSFSAATPEGAAPTTGMPSMRKRGSERMGGGRLSSSRYTHDANDSVATSADLSHHRRLLAR